MSEKSNPIFKNIKYEDEYVEEVNTSSYFGISIKTLVCLIITVLSGIGALFIPNVTALVVVLAIGGIGAFIAAFVGRNNAGAAMACSIIYSIGQGVSLGVVTALCELAYPGLAFSAILSTITVFGVTLFFFSTGLVRASGKLRKFVLISLVSIMVLSLIALICSLFGNFAIADLFYGTGAISILISAFVVFLGAFLLILDFDEAANIVEGNYPKKYEWVSTLGLMISIIYIYIHVLELLIKIAASKRD